MIWFGLTACGSPPPDEQQISDRIGVVVAAIQAKDAGLVLEHLEADFLALDQLRAANIQGLLVYYGRRHQNLRVVPSHIRSCSMADAPTCNSTPCSPAPTACCPRMAGC